MCSGCPSNTPVFLGPNRDRVVADFDMELAFGHSMPGHLPLHSSDTAHVRAHYAARNHAHILAREQVKKP